jgi:NitT/TauT family transport system substrate-binding protein
MAALPLLTLAACGYGSEAKDDGTAKVAAGAKKIDGLDSVKIGYFGNLTHGTALVGVDKGFFQKELGATKASYATFNAGPSEIEALNSKSIDIGWIGPSPAINGYVKSGGKSLKIIGGSASGGVKLVVNPDKIKSLKDVKGKKIATPQLGNTQDVAFLNWIADQGWKVDAQSGKGDVTVVRTDNKITPDAYKAGSIDGAWVPEPTASKLVAEGAKVLLDEASLWPDKKFVITNIIVRQDFLKEHPKAVEAVLRASVEANGRGEGGGEQAAGGGLRQGAQARGPGPGVEVDPVHQRPAGRHAQRRGGARGQGRSAGEARPERDLRPHDPQQGPQGRRRGPGRRRRSRHQLTPVPEEFPGGDDHGHDHDARQGRRDRRVRRTP